MNQERGVLSVDVEAVEKAEASLDKFINSRSRAKDKANEEARRQRAEDRRRHDEYREEHRVLWAAHLRRLSENYMVMARDARRRARALESQPKGKQA